MNQRPRQSIAPWIALCFSFGLTACASSASTTVIEEPQGLIDLNARIPAGDSPYGIAYGAPTRANVRPNTPDLDAFLKPEFAEKTARMAAPVQVAELESNRAPRDVQAPRLARASAPLPEPVLAAPAPLLAMAQAPAPTPDDDSSRYAQREAQNQNLEQFRGGDAIVITTGTLIVVLLIVILILLLT